MCPLRVPEQHTLSIEAGVIISSYYIRKKLDANGFLSSFIECGKLCLKYLSGRELICKCEMCCSVYIKRCLTVVFCSEWTRR